MTGVQTCALPILVPAHDRDALGRALGDALDRDWDVAAILAHAGRFRWDDNVRRLDRIVRDAAAAPGPS